MHNEVVAAVLADAKRQVEKGWIKGAATNYTGSVCAGEAIRRGWENVTERSSHSLFLTERDTTAGAVYQEVHSVFQGVIGFSSIPGWNDQPCRTRGEVLDAFDRAIEVVSKTPEPVVIEAPEVEVPFVDKMKALIGV